MSNKRKIEIVEIHDDEGHSSSHFYYLPKQFGYWLKKAGLKPEWKRANMFYGAYVGLGHRWRINMYGQFQCSCPIEDFDRWANSSTDAQFDITDMLNETIALEMIKSLRKRAREYVEQESEE